MIFQKTRLPTGKSGIVSDHGTAFLDVRTPIKFILHFLPKCGIIKCIGNTAQRDARVSLAYYSGILYRNFLTYINISRGKTDSTDS